jgi:hypothetical protein
MNILFFLFRLIHESFLIWEFVAAASNGLDRAAVIVNGTRLSCSVLCCSLHAAPKKGNVHENEIEKWQRKGSANCKTGDETKVSN